MDIYIEEDRNRPDKPYILFINGYKSGRFQFISEAMNKANEIAYDSERPIDNKWSYQYYSDGSEWTA
jgi:hypothetical protein